MAAYYLFMENYDEFLQKMKDKDPDLVLKSVKCILNAIKRKKKKVDIFDITFKDCNQTVFTINDSNYLNYLNHCVNTLILMDTSECYLFCARIRDLNIKASKCITYKKQNNVKEV